MRAYIRENLKTILMVTAVLVSVVVGVGTKELIAKILPDVSKLEVITYDMDAETYDYTGEEVEAKVSSIEFRDEEGNSIVKCDEEIEIISYTDNIECGKASVEISVDGYRGTVLLKSAFFIQPAQVKGVQITQATRENIDLIWEEVVGADGYYIYRSTDGGANYKLVKVVKSDEELCYQDTDIQLNSLFMYYVKAYVTLNEEPICGIESDIMKQATPLETPVLTSVKNTSYNSIQLQWEVVEGAAGYQVFRGLTQDGEYECIAELEDALATSYADATCTCGVTYYYYIKACQVTDTQKTYGEASGILSGMTVPNCVSLSGTTTNDDTQVTLNWKQSAGAQGYEIYRSKDTKSNYQLIKTVESSNTLTWSESGLVKESAYYYRIRPYCVVDGVKITGSYSGSYEKVATYVYDAATVSSGLAAIRQYAGKVQYVWGGKTNRGWDCSGFVYWVYKNHLGINLPQNTSGQASLGTTISKTERSSWKPGDLLFYTEGSGVSHVAIYLGNGELIHALSSKYDTLIQGVDYYERWDPATSLVLVKRIF